LTQSSSVRLTRAGVITLALVSALLVSFGAATVWRIISDPGEAEPYLGRALAEGRPPGYVPTSSKEPRLHAPEVGIDAPLVPIQLKDTGVLDPPQSVSTVGWWDASAEAGARKGQTVLTGHTVNTGGGVMDDLEELEPGDAVHVTDPDGRVDYEVTEVVTWSKAELAENAVEAFGQDRHHGRLVLVTCEDWEGDVYQSNVVVFADPVTGSEASQT
jgi:LPXTG-site transpeptidase (sortase) family protein